ncbi:MAG: hypothetical protein H0T51_05345 [Pirellulales bacterium]|nr:hypothetical protein [Pirellulales bacterium]
MAESIVIDLPNGQSIEVNDSEWTELASANWNRLEDDGYVQWTQTIRRHKDGRILVYVIYLPTSGILRTAGEILSAGSKSVANVVERLAEQFDVPTNVPHFCIEGYKRASGGQHG